MSEPDHPRADGGEQLIDVLRDIEIRSRWTRIAHVPKLWSLYRVSHVPVRTRVMLIWHLIWWSPHD